MEERRRERDALPLARREGLRQLAEERLEAEARRESSSMRVGEAVVGRP